jgi:hypothetical protein
MRGTVVLVAAGALAAPATAAAAPALSLPSACLVSGQAVDVAGTGFGAGAQVALSGGLSASATADGFGAFKTTATAPVTTVLKPKSFSVNAADSADPSIAAPPLAFSVIRETLDGNYSNALTGAPRHTTTWRFAGFTAGQPIYGHFRKGGHTYRDFRFGVAKGVCGTLTTRAPRVPVTVIRTGTWTLQMDQRRKFRTTTQPHRSIRFSLSRR